MFVTACMSLSVFKAGLTYFTSFSEKARLIIHRFYIALFSALEKTHCAHVACDSEFSLMLEPRKPFSCFSCGFGL